MSKIIHRILCASDECPQRKECFRRNAKRQGFISDQVPPEENYFDKNWRKRECVKGWSITCPYFLKDEKDHH